jgi:Helix-turn-helix domain
VFQIVAIPFDALQHLPPLEFKVMAALLRYVDRVGRCWPALRQLAQDVGKSESTVCRAMQRLAADYGCFVERRRPGNGRYRYKIAARFLPRWPGKQPKQRQDIAAMQDGLAQRASEQAIPIKQEEAPRQRDRFAKPRVSFSEMPDDRAKWDARLRSWRQSRFWLPLWGPKPTEAGCFAPLAALRLPKG